MNIGVVFLISALDALAVIPFNSELSFLNFINSRKYRFKKYVLISTLLYVIPSIFGTLIAYTVGYLFGNEILIYINYITKNIFTYNFEITNNDLLKTLILKIFIPVIPISLINILCGIYKANIIKFLIISFLLRYIRILFLYNAILFKSIYYYIRILLYSGLWTLIVRISNIIFYKFM